jgi:IclR family KDG regulon transcriptional repressor
MNAISKALEVLDLFLKTSEALGVIEVSRLTGLNSATTYRIVSTLVKCGYLEQLGKRGKYLINTTKLLECSSIATPSLKIRNLAIPFLRELSSQIRETTQIAIPLGNVAFKEDFAFVDNILNVQPSRENIIDLYSTANGKVFLAYMSDEEFREYCESTDIKPKTPHTITDWSVLKKHLNKIRREGISFDNQEQRIGVVSIGAPVKGPDSKVIAAISVIAPSARIDLNDNGKTVDLIKECAARISQAIH